MFDEIYESQFFFIENMDGNTQCMICHHVLSLPSSYFIKRHYLTCHGEFEKIEGRDRTLKVLELKASFFLKFVVYELNNNNDIYNISNIDDDTNIMKNQDGNITNISNDSNISNISDILKENEHDQLALKKASFTVALALAKQCRPFQDSSFFVQLTTDVLECFGEKCKEAIQLLQSIPLSRDTVIRRTEDLSHYIFYSAKERLKNCKNFSIALDESTDINSICRLVICIKTVDANLETFEEVLDVIPFHGHVTGKHLYDALKEHVFALAEEQKLSSICSDGAKVMRGENKGLLGLLRENGIQCPAFHCVIHQQTLFAKQLNISNTMNVSVKIINKIRGGHNALSHRKFKDFLKTLDTDYGDLLLYTEIRWLSKGKSLERLFNLRKEILMFFKENPKMKADDLIASLEDEEFLLDLAFLCDVTEILNELNTSLQGKNISIFQLATTINNFDRKLFLLIRELKSNNICFFKKTSLIFTELKINSFTKIETYAEIIESLKKNLEDRFQDLKCIGKIIELHNFPLSCKIEDQSEELQEELTKLRKDFEIPLESGQRFWKNINDNKYQKIKTEIYKLYSMFGTTYNCEIAFSSLKIILSKTRNRLSDQHVADLLRIKEYRGPMDLDEIINNHTK